MKQLDIIVLDEEQTNIVDGIEGQVDYGLVTSAISPKQLAIINSHDHEGYAVMKGAERFAVGIGKNGEWKDTKGSFSSVLETIAKSLESGGVLALSGYDAIDASQYFFRQGFAVKVYRPNASQSML